MKRTFTVILGLLLLLCATVVLADASVLRQEGKFSIQFTDSTITEVHAMSLRQGDLLEIQASVTDGFANVIVKHSNGEVLYSGLGDGSPGFSIEIPRTEIYRITIEGQDAVGSIRVNSTNVRETADPGDTPFRLERIVSTLGYLIEYDPDFFVYEQAGASESEFFYGVDQTASEDAFVWLARMPLSLEDAVAETLAIDGFAELDASVIDFRAARTLRSQQGDSPESLIHEYTLIEMGDNEVFYLVAGYPVANEETAAAKVARMIDSLRFTH